MRLCVWVCMCLPTKSSVRTVASGIRVHIITLCEWIRMTGPYCVGGGEGGYHGWLESDWDLILNRTFMRKKIHNQQRRA